MARDVCNKNYYRMANKDKELPIRWAAVEVLESSKFTVKTDVVSERFYANESSQMIGFLQRLVLQILCLFVVKEEHLKTIFAS